MRFARKGEADGGGGGGRVERSRAAGAEGREKREGSLGGWERMVGRTANMMEGRGDGER